MLCNQTVFHLRNDYVDCFCSFVQVHLSLSPLCLFLLFLTADTAWSGLPQHCVCFRKFVTSASGFGAILRYYAIICNYRLADHRLCYLATHCYSLCRQLVWTFHIASWVVKNTWGSFMPRYDSRQQTKCFYLPMASAKRSQLLFSTDSFQNNRFLYCWIGRIIM